jgi:peptidoglycan/LPS O-acetylase OafA/YrhL
MMDGEDGLHCNIIKSNTLLDVERAESEKEISIEESSKPNTVRRQKLHYLDGIRGWAAFSVAIFHLFDKIYKDLNFRLPTRNHLETFLFRFIIWNGRLSVTIFFVLSGRVIALSYLNTKNPKNLVSSMIRRPFRLFIPVLASYLLHYLFQVLDWKDPNILNAREFVKVGLEWYTPKKQIKSLGDLFLEGILLFIPPYSKPSFANIGLYWTIPQEYDSFNLDSQTRIWYIV